MSTPAPVQGGGGGGGGCVQACAKLAWPEHYETSQHGACALLTQILWCRVLTVELALELGQDKGNSLGSSGGGGDDVEGSSTRATQVTVGCVEQPLVSSVGVGGGHHCLDDAKLLVQHLHHPQQLRPGSLQMVSWHGRHGLRADVKLS